MRLSPALVRSSLGLLLLVGCAQGRGCERASDRYDRSMLAQSLDPADDTGIAGDPGLILGEFPLAKDAIVDGDTIKVGQLDSSLRLLAIDTEETFKSKKELAMFERLGFEGYLAAKSKETDGPVKCASPMGMEAKKWALEFFDGVSRVRLERDHPKELRGRYNRLLVYVFVEKDGQWINYNLEAVRAGMSPYFTKYGYSRRFHDAFVQAQDEAREAQRGIWNPDKQHYPDYDARLAWWNARADFIASFEAEAKERDDLIVLTHWDALDKLENLEGEEVEILGGVGAIHPREGDRPTRALLSRRMFSDFPLIFFDQDVFESSGIEDAAGEFVRVRGTVTVYRYASRKRNQEDREQLQIVVKVPEQIKTSRPTVDGRPIDLSRASFGRLAPGSAPEATTTPDTPSTPAPSEPEAADEPAAPQPPPASRSPEETPSGVGDSASPAPSVPAPQAESTVSNEDPS